MARRSTTTRDRHRKRQPPRRCASCGATGVPLQQDHIINLAAGGQDVVANMQWLCCAGSQSCHALKSERERQDGLARARVRRGGISKRRRDIEQHPVIAGQWHATDSCTQQQYPVDTPRRP